MIDLGRDGKVQIFTSPDIEKEIADKLSTKFKLHKNEVNQILSDLSSFTIPVMITNKYQVIQDDPDDDKFIDCAMQCKANIIVSGDRHLLNLKTYESIRIMNAANFLTMQF